jgi:hypoxanthine phosphoribosyltransferase
MFMAHLLPYIRCKVEIDFMTISSYKHGTKSRDFKFIQDLDSEVKGRDILIVEDIIDSGRTMSFTLGHLGALGAASIETAVLINKTKHRKYDIKPPKYIGFEYNDDRFLIGFGFDYDGLYRNLPDVYQMEEGDEEKLSNE